MRQPTPHYYPLVLFCFIALFIGKSVLVYAEEAVSPSAPIILAKNQPTHTVVNKIRHSNSAKGTRVVIDLTRSVSYAVTRDPSSQTLLVKLEEAVLGKYLKLRPSYAMTGNLIDKIEVTQRGDKTVYISLLYKQLGSHKHLILEHPDRLVIDLFPPEAMPPPVAFSIQTIVIDPGHGGKDPGARSRGGLEEKDIALDISRRLKKLVESRLNKKVIMTRDEDVFITLKRRTEIANENKADLFVSVHINSSVSGKLRGIEVYLLGKASDKRALSVAARENAETHKDVVGFEEIILNDLEKDFTRKASLELAHFTNDALKRNLISKYPTKALGVKRAPFYVLNHTEMPAILAEISFISNRKEEKRLKNPQYRQRAAEALLKGIESYIHSLGVGA